MHVRTVPIHLQIKGDAQSHQCIVVSRLPVNYHCFSAFPLLEGNMQCACTHSLHEGSQMAGIVVSATSLHWSQLLHKTAFCTLQNVWECLPVLRYLLVVFYSCAWYFPRGQVP